ncbi:MAG TPA: YciI family protein, partial [Myxococcaceae bacterium]|nr:YciI family protein [Myxococcaceae bacterium]
MLYAMMMYETESALAKRNDPVKSGPYWASWMAYSRAVEEAGIFVSGAGLLPPSSATTLRVSRGERRVQDGPLADSKEQLGGFFVVELPDLDA